MCTIPTGLTSKCTGLPCRRWLLGLLILQSISSVVLDSYQNLLKEHIVVTFFLTMLVRPTHIFAVAPSVRPALDADVILSAPALAMMLCTGCQQPPGRNEKMCAELRCITIVTWQVGAGGNAGNQ